MKKIVTSEQLAEGYVQFVDGVIIRRRFTGVQRQEDGTYQVDWPPIDPPGTEPDRIPVVDAR